MMTKFTDPEELADSVYCEDIFQSMNQNCPLRARRSINKFLLMKLDTNAPSTVVCKVQQ